MNWTGSGKTFTMVGSQADPGIIPRSIEFIFTQVENISSGWEYSVSISMYQIYNDTIYDLFDEDREPKKFKSNTNEIENLVVKTVTHSEDLLDLWSTGMNQRTVASTTGNIHSSRSHAITELHIVGTNHTYESNRNSKITLFDLAGSESPKESKNMTETKSINSSLSALNGVFHAFRSGMSVNFNQTLLTRALKTSFEGKKKTLLIANLSTDIADIDTTLNTARFTQFK